MNTHTISIKALALVVPALLLLGACGEDDSTNAPSAAPTQVAELDGRTFTFTDVQVSDTGAPPANDGDGISLTFTETGISATGGCNTMTGKASVSEGELDVSNSLAMTEMGCDPTLMDQDSWFADLLMAKPDMTVDGETLTLTAAGTVLTMTDGEGTEPTTSLVGPTWRLDTLIETHAVASVPQGVRSTVEFSDDGRVTVEFGCNSGSGMYEVAGDTITFNSISTTQIGCGGSEGDVEGVVTKTLDGEVTYVIDGQFLTLTDGDEGLVYLAA